MAIRVYGTDGCHQTQVTRNYLDQICMPYDYVNIDRDPAGRQWVIDQCFGKQRTPVVDVDGKVLREPSNNQIEGALQQRYSAAI